MVHQDIQDLKVSVVIVGLKEILEVLEQLEVQDSLVIQELMVLLPLLVTQDKGE